jgi:hypothetical protein
MSNDTSRAAFEACMKQLGHDYCFDLNGAGEYRWADCYGAFDAWQASRKAALEEAMQVAGPEDSHQDEWFKAKADSYKRIKELLK